MLNGSEVGNDKRRTTGRDIHPRAVGLRLCQRVNGGRRNLVGLETHERAVNVEE